MLFFVVTYLNSVNLEYSGRFKDLRRCLIASGGQPSDIQQLALQPINYIEIHVTNSLSQPYKSNDFKIFKKTTRFQLTMLSIGLRGQWKWALNINPLEALDSYSV